MKTTLIHLEHAMPPLAELGLEHLVPLFLGGGQVSLDQSAILNILKGLSEGAKKRAARRLVAVSRATGEDLLSWEVDNSKESAALNSAALLGFDEAKEAISGFFESLGVSLNAIQASSDAMVETPKATDQDTY